MNTLNADVTRSILYLLDDDSLFNACSVNEHFSKKICNDTFWFNKILNKYPLTADEIRLYAQELGVFTTEGFQMGSPMHYYKYLRDNISALTVDDILWKGITHNREDLVKIALRKGADPNNRGGYSLVLKSSTNGYTNILKLLLEYKAMLHDGALAAASAGGYIDTVKFLLENGADVNARHGEALLWAVKRGRLETVRILLENGANPSERVISLAREIGYDDIAELLVAFRG